MKASTLAAGLKAAALPRQSATRESRRSTDKDTKAKPQRTVLIGGNFPAHVRSALLLVQADERNSGKTLKQLLGEAINDLCAKYGKPQPYSEEDEAAS